MADTVSLYQKDMKLKENLMVDTVTCPICWGSKRVRPRKEGETMAMVAWKDGDDESSAQDCYGCNATGVVENTEVLGL